MKKLMDRFAAWFTSNWRTPHETGETKLFNEIEFLVTFVLSIVIAGLFIIKGIDHLKNGESLKAIASPLSVIVLIGPWLYVMAYDFKKNYGHYPWEDDDPGPKIENSYSEDKKKKEQEHDDHNSLLSLN